MRWEDERYIRVYTRDTVDWLGLSFDAQGLMLLILRKVDRAGILVLGKHGPRAVAIAIGHPHLWPRLEPALQDLLDDGCVRIDGDMLVVPNFMEAQEAKQSDKLRQAEHRAKARDRAASRDTESRTVTGGHETLRNVASASHEVTPAVPSRADPAVPDRSPTENGDQSATPRQEPLDFEPPAPPEDPTDIPGNEAVWKVFDHWRGMYPEHAHADCRGARPKLIKLAIDNRRKVLNCSRRAAVEAVKAAISQAPQDPYLSGQEKDGKVKTELTAILETSTFERLCRMAEGTPPAKPTTAAARGDANRADLRELGGFRSDSHG